MSQSGPSLLTPVAFPLRDGTQALIRPIRSSDAPQLQALVKRLSPESIYLRFLEPRVQLTDQAASRLANVDCHVTMAYVAEINADGNPQLIAVARYNSMGASQSDAAEVGVVVEDAYQDQGLGRFLLLARLIPFARTQNIRTLVGFFHHSNARILKFVRESGFATRRKLDAGLWEAEIDISDPMNEQPANG
jgi:GNAT superfamily N-acetyltransferase